MSTLDTFAQCSVLQLHHHLLVREILLVHEKNPEVIANGFKVFRELSLSSKDYCYCCDNYKYLSSGVNNLLIKSNIMEMVFRLLHIHEFNVDVLTHGIGILEGLAQSGTSHDSHMMSPFKMCIDGHSVVLFGRIS